MEIENISPPWAAPPSSPASLAGWAGSTFCPGNSLSLFVVPVSAVSDAGRVEDYLDLLDSEEQARYQQCLLPREKAQYLASRVLLRTVLARYAGCAPQEIAFEREPHGRPYLVNYPTLQFSLSHSRRHVALIVGTQDTIGVDVEATCPLRPSFEHIAAQHFAAEEVQALRDCPSTQRFARFIEMWTLKEAYVKALGLGLAKPLSECRFNFGEQGQIGFSDTESSDDPAQWLFQLFRLDDDSRLAVASRGGGMIDYYTLARQPGSAALDLQPLRTSSAY